MAIPTKPVIDDLPAAPQRTDLPQTFASKADTFVAALQPFKVDIDAAIDWHDTVFIATENEATNAANSATLSSEWATTTNTTVDGSDYSAKEYAVGVFVPAGSAKEWATSTVDIGGGLKGAKGYAEDAQTSANASAASANFKGEWSTLTGALNKPASVRHSNVLWILLNNLANVTLSEPGVSADWDYIYFPSFTGQAGNTLKVNTTENGLEWGPGLIAAYQEFTASGTFTPDPKASWVYVEIVNGGNSGGAFSYAVAANYGVNSGGGGAYLSKLFRKADLPSNVNIVVGSGGGAVSVVGNDSTSVTEAGLLGGVSSFNEHAPPIGLSVVSKTFSAFAAPDDAIVNHINSSPASNSEDYPANCIYGGAGGGRATTNSALNEKSGGVSEFHGNGGTARAARANLMTGTSLSGGNGGFPGGGGGGASISGAAENPGVNYTATSGAGGDGVVRVWQW